MFKSFIEKLISKPNVSSKNIDEILIPEIAQQSRPKFLNAIYEIETPNNYEGYFKNGELVNVSPRNRRISLYEDRKVAYAARYIISDGVRYDLENPESIKNIIIPHFKDIDGMPNTTSDMSYIIRMKANKENRPELAVPLCYKAANLMLATPIAWGKKDYYMIIKHLWLIGEVKYADYLLKNLEKRLPFMTDDNFHHKQHFMKEMNLARKTYNSDLLEISVIGCPCSECAKYQGRIYSISGKHPKYPPLPKFIVENYGTHCRNSIRARMDFGNNDETIQIYKFDKEGNCKMVDVNAIEYSNRPFIDNRSEYEKRDYESYIEQYTKDKQADEKYCNRDYWIDKYHSQLEYQNIVDLLGDNAPKSYSGYMRMKNQNTKNYQKIKELAKTQGIIL